MLCRRQSIKNLDSYECSALEYAGWTYRFSSLNYENAVKKASVYISNPISVGMKNIKLSNVTIWEVWTS